MSNPANFRMAQTALAVTALLSELGLTAGRLSVDAIGDIPEANVLFNAGETFAVDQFGDWCELPDAILEDKLYHRAGTTTLYGLTMHMRVYCSRAAE